ncbi:MAG: protein of unknown function [Nitrospira sp.]
MFWIDGRPLWKVLEPYRRKILKEALFTLRPDGSPQYRRVLTGRAKKNSKTTDGVLAAIYKCMLWKAAGGRENQVYLVASDLAQANDDLELCKLLIKRNPLLDERLRLKSNVVERKDGGGFIEILPAGDAAGLHGKTYLFLVVDELHTQKDYRLLEALEIDRTRPDAVQWFCSYASLYRQAGVPLNDLLRQHEKGTDPRLYVSWYSGTVDEANPSLNGPLGPTMADIEDAQRALPSWIFRRLYLNLPGQPDGAALTAEKVEDAVVKGRTVLPPQPGIAYSAFTDMSGGGADDATLAIAHLTDEGQVAIDLLLDQGPRNQNGIFDPNQATRRFADAMKQYGCLVVTGDRYAGEWPRKAFEAHGIHYDIAEQNRSQLYANLEPLLNAGTVQLLDDATLLAQLIGLIRKGEKIDHPSGEHDDRANAVAGATALLKSAGPVPRIRDFLTDDERRASAIMASQREARSFAARTENWSAFIRGHER